MQQSEEIIIDTLSFQIQVRVLGNALGQKTILLFHGFGQTSKSFEPLMNQLSEEYRCIAIDLFYHGNSEWKKKNAITVDEWNSVLINLINKFDLHNFEVLGYSLGARFAIATFFNMPIRVKCLYLVAPDGVYNNKYYNFITRFKFTQYLFKSTMYYPHWFIKVLNLLQKTSIFHPSLIRFAKANLNTKSNRLRIFKTWIQFRTLLIPFSEISTMLRKHGTESYLIISTNDHIIPKNRLVPLVQKIKSMKVVEYQCTHSGLMNKLKIFFKNK